MRLIKQLGCAFALLLSSFSWTMNKVLVESSGHKTRKYDAKLAAQSVAILSVVPALNSFHPDTWKTIISPELFSDHPFIRCVKKTSDNESLPDRPHTFKDLSPDGSQHVDLSLNQLSIKGNGKSRLMPHEKGEIINCHRWSNQGKRLLTQSHKDGRHTTWHIWDTATGNLILTFNKPNYSPIYYSSPSPFNQDDSKICIVDDNIYNNEWGLHVWDLNQTPAKILCEKARHFFRGWSNDGSQLAARTREQTVVLNAITGNVDCTLQNSEHVSMAVWSPNNQYIAARAICSDTAIHNAHDGTPLQILEQSKGSDQICWSPDNSRLAATINYSSIVLIWNIAPHMRSTKPVYQYTFGTYFVNVINWVQKKIIEVSDINSKKRIGITATGEKKLFEHGYLTREQSILLWMLDQAKKKASDSPITISAIAKDNNLETAVIKHWIDKLHPLVKKALIRFYRIQNKISAPGNKQLFVSRTKLSPIIEEPLVQTTPQPAASCCTIG